MRKNALINSCYVCAAGAFGTFFRWLQNQSVFDAETGLVNPSALNILVPLGILGAAVLFYFLVRKLKARKFEAPGNIFAVFNGTSILYPIAYFVIAFVTVLGGIVTIVCLMILGQIFGQQQMLIVSLAVIVVVLLALRDRLEEKEEKEVC